MGKSVKYPQEVLERAVRMVRDHEHEYPTRAAAVESITGKIGCTAQTLVNWIRKTEPVFVAAAYTSVPQDNPGYFVGRRAVPEFIQARLHMSTGSQNHTANGDLVRVFKKLADVPGRGVREIC